MVSEAAESALTQEEHQTIPRSRASETVGGQINSLIESEQIDHVDLHGVFGKQMSSCIFLEDEDPSFEPCDKKKQSLGVVSRCNPRSGDPHFWEGGTPFS